MLIGYRDSNANAWITAVIRGRTTAKDRDVVIISVRLGEGGGNVVESLVTFLTMIDRVVNHKMTSLIKGTLPQGNGKRAQPTAFNRHKACKSWNTGGDAEITVEPKRGKVAFQEGTPKGTQTLEDSGFMGKLETTRIILKTLGQFIHCYQPRHTVHFRELKVKMSDQNPKDSLDVRQTNTNSGLKLPLLPCITLLFRNENVLYNNGERRQMKIYPQILPFDNHLYPPSYLQRVPSWDRLLRIYYMIHRKTIRR
jgi:hypothetical protein